MTPQDGQPTPQDGRTVKMKGLTLDRFLRASAIFSAIFIFAALTTGDRRVVIGTLILLSLGFLFLLWRYLPDRHWHPPEVHFGRFPAAYDSIVPVTYRRKSRGSGPQGGKALLDVSFKCLQRTPQKDSDSDDILALYEQNLIVEGELVDGVFATSFDLHVPGTDAINLFDLRSQSRLHWIVCFTPHDRSLMPATRFETRLRLDRV